MCVIQGTLRLTSLFLHSSCYFLDNSNTLDDAEDQMLEMYCTRAQIKDGHSILDVGCGWGSFSLYIAKKYKNCNITGICNSATQKVHIEERCRWAWIKLRPSVRVCIISLYPVSSLLRPTHYFILHGHLEVTFEETFLYLTNLTQENEISLLLVSFLFFTSPDNLWNGFHIIVANHLWNIVLKLLVLSMLLSVKDDCFHKLWEGVNLPCLVYMLLKLGNRPVCFIFEKGMVWLVSSFKISVIYTM